MSDEPSTSAAATAVGTAGGAGSVRIQRRRTAVERDTEKENSQVFQQLGLKQENHSLYMYSSIAAGVGSGALASILCAPLDLVRTRLQVWGQVHAAAAATSAAVTTAAVKTRRTPKLSAIPSVVQDIARREGARGLFRGLGATLVTVPAFWGVYFPLYDDSKRYLWAHFATPDTPAALVHMSSAVLAGAVADLLCNPMFVVRTRLQTEAMHQSSNTSTAGLGTGTGTGTGRASMLQTAKQLYIENGRSISIFWRGMSANLLGLSHVAVQFPVYEHFKVLLRERKQLQLQQQQQQQLQQQQQQQSSSSSSTTTVVTENTPLELLLASSMSKMMACLISYPHEVMRSRLMDHRGNGTNGKKITLIKVCRTIHQQEGWRGFYAGLPVTLLRVLPNTCVTFLSYELILRYTWNSIQNRQ